MVKKTGWHFIIYLKMPYSAFITIRGEKNIGRLLMRRVNRCGGKFIENKKEVGITCSGK